MRNLNAIVSDPNTFFTNPGDSEHVVFSSILEKDGTISLVPSGYEDIQEKIDSFRSQTDFSWILNQLALGNTSVLEQREPMYGDFTAVPKTYAEALQLVMDGEEQFSKLPKDVRNQFDNDFRKWFATAGSDEWFFKMNTVSNEIVPDQISADSEKSTISNSEVKS